MTGPLQVLFTSYGVVVVHLESIVEERLRTQEVFHAFPSLLLCFLARFSLTLQQDKANLCDAVDAFDTLSLELVSYTLHDGIHLQFFLDGVQWPQGLFKGIQLNSLPS